MDKILIVVLFAILLAFASVAKGDKTWDIPANMDHDAYCDMCHTAAAALYKNLHKDKMTLYEAWSKLCTESNFPPKGKYSRRELSDACHYLQQPSDETYPMYEMVKQMVDHDGEERELRAAMCHMNSDACAGQKKRISDVPTGSADFTAEDLQKYLNSNEIKRPQPVRKEEL